MEEVFKDVLGYEGKYQVSNTGKVFSILRKRVIHTEREHKGYLRVNLWRNGKRKHVPVHRLVALAFIPNPENKPQVNHIDFNKENNRADNLEWCTNDENQVHAAKMRKEIK